MVFHAPYSVICLSRSNPIVDAAATSISTPFTSLTSDQLQEFCASPEKAASHIQVLSRQQIKRDPNSVMPSITPPLPWRFESLQSTEAVDFFRHELIPLRVGISHAYIFFFEACSYDQ